MLESFKKNLIKNETGMSKPRGLEMGLKYSWRKLIKTEKRVGFSMLAESNQFEKL